MLLSYVLFFVAGLGFGYAAPPRFKPVALAFPLLLALLAALQGSFDGGSVVPLIAALAVTAVGIALGWLLDGGAAPRGARPA